MMKKLIYTLLLIALISCQTENEKQSYFSKDIIIGYVVLSDSIPGAIDIHINDYGIEHENFHKNYYKKLRIEYEKQSEQWKSINKYLSKQDLWNGTFREEIYFSIKEDRLNFVGTLEKKGGGNLTMMFSDGISVLDCTPPLKVTLMIHKPNFVYIPISTKNLTSNTIGFPCEEHIRVKEIDLRATKFHNNFHKRQVEHIYKTPYQEHIKEFLSKQKLVWNKGFDITAFNYQDKWIGIVIYSGSYYETWEKKMDLYNGLEEINTNGIIYGEYTIFVWIENGQVKHSLNSISSGAKILPLHSIKVIVANGKIVDVETTDMRGKILYLKNKK